jgi:hypothetical protein
MLLLHARFFNRNGQTVWRRVMVTISAFFHINQTLHKVHYGQL